MTPKKFRSWSKLSFWEMTPGYPTLWVWCWKIVDTSKTCKILLYFGKWQIFPLFVSRPNTYEWVSESLKCTKVAVNDFVGCLWMQPKILLQKIIQNSNEIFVCFWEMTASYPTWCRVGRVVLSRNDKLLLGGKITFNLLRYNRKGDGHNWIWAKLPFVELSQVTGSLGGITSTFLCRDRHDCIWTKLPWVEFS